MIMTYTPPNSPNSQLELINVEDLIKLLRRKEGTWVEWGQACATLQKAGYSTQQIFEETGFEPVHQNQVIVGAQVYTSLVNQEAPAPVQEYFQRKGSDILYEFRILGQQERVSAAQLILDKGLDTDEARQVAKAMKELSRFHSVPEGFSRHPGDAVAYQCWKSARQHQDLQERSRLIARGLKFAHSEGARHQIEQLLTDFTVVPKRSAPRLPVYRLEAEEQHPLIVPVVGEWPITRDDLQAVPLLETTGPFQLVKFSGVGAWVAVPGWQVLLKAEDLVTILGISDQLPYPLSGPPENVLMMIDRAQRQWDIEGYFLVEQGNQLDLQWFEESPDIPLLGRLVLIMRPQKILDADLSKDQWQIDE